MSVTGPADGVDRREHPRETVCDSVKVVVGAGHVVEATVVDRSLRGLRLRLADAAALSGEVTVLYPSRGLVHVGRVAWRTPPYAGLSITRTVEMRTATGPDSAGFRKLWRENIA